MTLLRTILIFCFATAMSFALPAASAESLQIALTNDDGWDAPGIQVLYRELIKRGHQVILVGSATGQSGSGAAMDGGPVTLTKQADNQYSVALPAAADTAGTSIAGAEPLTCGMLAIDIATRVNGRTPDLLLSGINSGANIGSAALHSGTVGAVLGALNRSINGQHTGIAISTDEPKCDADCVDAHYTDVANYVADLLQSMGTPSAVLPTGVGLNINYPQRSRDKIQGTKISQQDPGFGFGGRRVNLQFQCADCAELGLGKSTTTKGIQPGAYTGPNKGAASKQSDVDAYNAGYVSIVPIAPNLTATKQQRLKRILSKLAPR